jgi:hypothetical protein
MFETSTTGLLTFFHFLPQKAPKKIVCTKCNQVWFCSTACQSDQSDLSTVHTGIECQALKHINTPKFDLFPFELTEVRLALRFPPILCIVLIKNKSFVSQMERK